MVTVRRNTLPIRERTKEDSDATIAPCDPIMTIHRVKSEDGIIISIQPPTLHEEPGDTHTPCDIVLVIDVSGSMKTRAPGHASDDQGKASKEDLGFTILDLVKHAAHTIVETLNEGDRLGIVTFSSRVEVIQGLVEMTDANKKSAISSIHKMVADGMTNLTQAINKGLELFEETDRVPAMMILTDGMPNISMPSRGFVQMIEKRIENGGPLPATIHTFGFGYDIYSGLLKSIAEIGRGNYSFIPDVGMIGTVLVHAVAHLQSTYATKCTIEISYLNSMTILTPGGPSVVDKILKDGQNQRLIINLGNLQYGQSRDIYLKASNARGIKYKLDDLDDGATIGVKLTWSRMQVEHSAAVSKSLLEKPDLPDDVVAYHQSRSMLGKFLSSFYPLTPEGEYGMGKGCNVDAARSSLQALRDKIPARRYGDEHNQSIMKDLDGQVSLALSSTEFFMKWGRHYFLSLWNAHAKQLCNSFKDPGPMKYNQNAFFTKCRDTLDITFNNTPPPKPTLAAGTPRSPGAVALRRGRYSMRSYNSTENPCFSDGCIRLADDTEVNLSRVQKGTFVKTLRGPRRVVAVLETATDWYTMCSLGDMLVTAWHPIYLHEGSPPAWVFPQDAPGVEKLPYLGTLYSVLLEADEDPDAHSVMVNDVWGVALGHGITSGKDLRAHPFLGDWQAVKAEIDKLEISEGGMSLCGGTRKKEGGLVCGFHPRN
ncbi:hint-domain-containing protein [Biscogniauxia mediterranea]|nr:hint-domain-containing protein [Biscogniauxia mediterranea]